MVANRVGTKRGASFAGLSTIVDASGGALNIDSPDNEEIIYGEVEPEITRKKHVTGIPGEDEVDYIRDRRPELYELIIKPVNESSY